MGEPFLRERWGEIAEKNIQESTPQPEIPRAVSTYLSIEEQINSLPDDPEKIKLEKLFATLNESILSYLIAIDRLTIHKLEGSLDKIENAEIRRKLTHNVLIDNLNILSRQFAAAGLDNSWRSDVGSDRRDITRWVLAVAECVRGKTLKEE
jgi:hypothetical protein